MSRSLAKAALTVSVALLAAGSLAAQPQVDHEGNSLPKEAIARVGSARMTVGGYVWAVAYSPDGKTIVSASKGDPVQFWDARTGRLRAKAELNTDSSATLAFHPDGKSVGFYGGGLFCSLDAE